MPVVLTPAARIKSEIIDKRSSCKIGDYKAIKTSVCTAQIKVKMGPVPTPGWQSRVGGAIKQSRSKNGPN